MHKVLFSLLLFLIGCSAQNKSIYQPDISGQSFESQDTQKIRSLPSANNDRFKRIDKTINAEIEAGKIPGVVALVSINGERVYHKSFGFADISHWN